MNKPVIIHLSSKDVIHSFSLIQMRVKQDTIPGESIPVWFTPTMVGDWEIPALQIDEDSVLSAQPPAVV